MHVGPTDGSSPTKLKSKDRLAGTMRPLPLALLLVTAALAGCVGNDTSTDDGADPAGFTTPANVTTAIEQDHDHGDASLHDLAYNIEQVGHHVGYEDPEDAPDEPAGFSEGFTNLAVHRPYAYLCRGGEAPGVVVIDVSDPAEPAFAAHVAMPQCNDIETSEDGRWVFAGTQRNTPQDVLAASEMGPASPPRGTYVIDASDPTQPTVESFFPMPYNGPHTITTYTTEDERLLVLQQSYDLYSTMDPTGEVPAAPPGAAPGTHRVVVTELTQAPDGTHQLERIGAYSATGATPQNPDEQVIVHDAVPATNPITNTTYLLVAYWDLGVHIVDFTDPSNPTLVGTFQDFAPSAFENIHEVRAFPTLIDGKWVLVAEPEIGTADESGQLTFIDASDPESPTKLGYWTLPGDVSITEPYLFSPHNFDLDDEGRIYLSHMHAGVWVIDVDDPGTFAEPATVGAIELTDPTGTAPGGPMTWAVEKHGDLLFASDTPTGLHVLEYTGP